jgi:hypothetical protein
MTSLCAAMKLSPSQARAENADHRHHPGAQGRRLRHLIDVHPGRHQHDRRHRHHHDFDDDRHAERALGTRQLRNSGKKPNSTTSATPARKR